MPKTPNAPNAVPGSAWDTWFKAGFAHARSQSTDSIKDAATIYAQDTPFRMEVVIRAFMQGAKAATA